MSALLLSNCLAGVVPISIYLSNVSGEGTYTVPAGKVLIVESLRQNVGPSGITHIYLNIEQTYVNDGGPVTFAQQFALSTQIATGRLFCLEKPLRFAEGTIVNKPSINKVETTQYYVYGLLIDASDLYAANVKTDMEATLITDTILRADVKLASSRPAVVKVDESTDMVNWDPVSAENVTTTTDGDRRSVEVSHNGERKFLRASASAIAKN